MRKSILIPSWIWAVCTLSEKRTLTNQHRVTLLQTPALDAGYWGVHWGPWPADILPLPPCASLLPQEEKPEVGSIS